LIKIWDTCGQERFRSLTANYYRNADGVLLVFDVNEPESFDNLKSWMISLNDNIKFPIPRVVLANKIDLNKAVSSYNLKNFQKENKVEVYECSAKLGTNVNEAFDYLIKEILKIKKQKDGDTIIVNNKPVSCNC
jgi:small GTP-binding protein